MTYGDIDMDDVRFYLMWVLMLILVTPSAMAATITLQYSECKNVTTTTSNDTYCAPENLTINKTAIYETCIGDLKGAFNSTSAEVRNVCTSTIAGQAAVFANLTASVQKLEGFNLSETYARCVIALNFSERNVTKWKEEAEQRSVELKAAQDGAVNQSVLQQCQSDRSIALSKAEATKDDLRNGIIVGVVIGAAGLWWWKRRTPSDELDTRGGRAPRPGRI